MNNRREQLCIEDAHIILRNFSGREGRYNREGDRSFAVVIDDPTLAQTLANDGWRVRSFVPKNAVEEEAEPINYIQIAVSFKTVPGIRPLEVYMIMGKRKVRLNEETIGELDYADIISADLIINPHSWNTVSGDHGIKGYLAKAYITVSYDKFDEKYANFEDLSRPTAILADD